MKRSLLHLAAAAAAAAPLASASGPGGLRRGRGAPPRRRPGHAASARRLNDEHHVGSDAAWEEFEAMMRAHKEGTPVTDKEWKRVGELVEEHEEEEKEAMREAEDPPVLPVCVHGGTCPESGSKCFRGYDECGGNVYHKYECLCGPAGGELEYACALTNACPEVARAGAGDSKSSKSKSSKSSKSKSAKSASGSDASSRDSQPAAGDGAFAAKAKSAKSADSSSSSSKSKSKSSKSSSSSDDGDRAASSSSAKSAKVKSAKSAKTGKSAKSSESSAEPEEKAVPASEVPAPTPGADMEMLTAAAPLPDDDDDDDDAPNNDPCSGEPCLFATWCRSRYGSCGPGFMYCNQWSTWELSCDPTEEPTPAPSPPFLRDSSSNFAAALDVADLELDYPDLATPLEGEVGGSSNPSVEKVTPLSTEDGGDDDPEADPRLGGGAIGGIVVGVALAALVATGVAIRRAKMADDEDRNAWRRRVGRLLHRGRS